MVVGRRVHQVVGGSQFIPPTCLNRHRDVPGNQVDLGGGAPRSALMVAGGFQVPLRDLDGSWRKADSGKRPPSAQPAGVSPLNQGSSLPCFRAGGFHKRLAATLMTNVISKNPATICKVTNARADCETETTSPKPAGLR
jgi:hypothetical protein